MKKIAVVLAGCGVYDGSEIHEAVLTLLSLNKAGASVTCFAPDIDQAHVVNHFTGEVVENEKRNVLAEAARIARGNISNITDLKSKKYDALIFPGGFGAAKNLSTFAFDGDKLKINEDVERVLREFNEDKKPIGIICIAPVMGAKVLGATVTIGNDAGVAEAICHLGGKHVSKSVNEIHIDEEKNVITTPAYMYETNISDVSNGIDKLVKEVVARA